MTNPASALVRVCFVCLGNICRSPLAEVVFATAVAAVGQEHAIHVDSAGTGAWHVGELADPRARQVAARHDLEMQHRARQFRLDDVARFDIIIVMDRANLAAINALVDKSTGPKPEVALLRSFERGASELDVPDPYTGNESDFEHVLAICQRATPWLLAYVTERAGLVRMRDEA